MSSTQEKHEPEFSSTSLPNEEKPSEETPTKPNGAIALPKASALIVQSQGRAADAVESAPDEGRRASTASELYERGLAIVGEAAAFASAHPPHRRCRFAAARLMTASAPQPPAENSRPRTQEDISLAAGLAVAVALALTIASERADRRRARSPIRAVGDPRGAASSPSRTSQTASGDHHWKSETRKVVPTARLNCNLRPSARLDRETHRRIRRTSPTRRRSWRSTPRRRRPRAPSAAVDSAVRGVSDKEIRFGMAAPFSGAARNSAVNEDRRRDRVQPDQRGRRRERAAIATGGGRRRL